jgi:putative SOS response-associated peptidase YedK
MCGRFALTLPDDAVARLFNARLGNDSATAQGQNICPTQAVLTILGRAGQRHAGPMRWGFLPHWYRSETDGPLLINARAETIAQKPAFAQANGPRVRMARACRGIFSPRKAIFWHLPGSGRSGRRATRDWQPVRS